MIQRAVQISIAALTLSAGSAFAQDLCGGVGASGQWIGGTQEGSDISTVSDYQQQLALVLGNNQYVALFDVTTAGDIRVEAQGRGTSDPLFDVFDASGAIVISDDDSGGNSAARAEFYAQPGTYCVAMRAFDNSPLTGFVRVGRLEHEPLTSGISDVPNDGDEGYVEAPICDSTTPAQSLTLNTEVTGSVQDSPFWRFTLDQPMALTITAKNADADPYITLYDASGVWMGENDDFEGLNSQLDISYPLAAGDYCIAMQALSDDTLPVSLFVTEYDAEAALRGMYDRAEAAPPLDGSYPVEALGVLGTKLRKDLTNTPVATWYSLDMPEAGVIMVDAISTGGMGDPFLALYDELGRQVAYNDDAAESFDSMLAARVMAGTYLLAVGEMNVDTSGPVRMMIERYVPAK